MRSFTNFTYYNVFNRNVQCKSIHNTNSILKSKNASVCEIKSTVRIMISIKNTTKNQNLIKSMIINKLWK